MALIHDQYEFCFPKKKKNGKWETEEEMIKRVDKELKDEDKKEYNNNIKRIIKSGFDKNQAKYLYQLEQEINELPRRSWRDRVF